MANEHNKIDAREPRPMEPQAGKHANPAGDMGENRVHSPHTAKNTGVTGSARGLDAGARDETDSNVDAGTTADAGTLIHEME